MPIDRNFLSQLNALNDASQSRNDFVRAPFGWPGGKTRSIKNLLSILPYRKVFADVYAGSGTVLFARNSCDLEVFNDRHAGITCFFRVVRDTKKCIQLIERLHMTVSSREEFIWCKETWDSGDFTDDVERAARWYYSIVNSFSQKGWAFGRATSGKNQVHKLHNNLELFWPINYRLRNVLIENADWRILLNDYNNEKNGDDTVWYLDPPYWGSYNIHDHEMKPEEHFEIGERCMHLNGFVALSGYDDPKHPYNTFKWDRKETWEVHVSMTGLAFYESNHHVGLEDQIQRGKAAECVWIRDTAR